MTIRKPTLAVVLFIAACTSTALAGPLVLSGSSTVQKLILEPSQKALESKTGVAIEVSGPGTIHGVKALMKGEVAAATASCPLDVVFQETGIPSEGTYQEHVIQQDTVVAIVHPGSKVKGLTLAQLADILSGKITNWKDVGDAVGRIVVVAPPPSSGTRAFVRDTVMKGAAYAGNAYAAVTDREAIEIPLDSPGEDGLAAFLRHRVQGEELAVRGTPRLLLELAPARGERVLTFVDLTFGDGPDAVVLRREVRAAGVYQKELELTLRPSIEENACAGLGHNDRVQGSKFPVQ